MSKSSDNRKYRAYSPPSNNDDDTTIVIKHSASKPQVKFEPMTESDYEDNAPHHTSSQLSIKTTINIDDSPAGQYDRDESDNEQHVYYPRAHRPKKKQYIPEPEPEKPDFIRYKIELTDSDDDDDDGDYSEAFRRIFDETSEGNSNSGYRDQRYNVRHQVALGRDGRNTKSNPSRQPTKKPSDLNMAENVCLS
ncbi:uncharacterized protein [Centruroides vittatus]|uniref:uncharacterized protein n=1 Tax=Centruroides vittatus TaxID=120091 RepID=UPI0035106E1C